jgi:hypothetical protein
MPPPALSSSPSAPSALAGGVLLFSPVSDDRHCEWFAHFDPFQAEARPKLEIATAISSARSRSSGAADIVEARNRPLVDGIMCTLNYRRSCAVAVPAKPPPVDVTPDKFAILPCCRVHIVFSAPDFRPRADHRLSATPLGWGSRTDPTRHIAPGFQSRMVVSPCPGTIQAQLTIAAGAGRAATPAAPQAELDAIASRSVYRKLQFARRRVTKKKLFALTIAGKRNALPCHLR